MISPFQECYHSASSTISTQTIRRAVNRWKSGSLELRTERECSLIAGRLMMFKYFTALRLKFETVRGRESKLSRIADERRTDWHRTARNGINHWHDLTEQRKFEMLKESKFEK